MLYGDVSLTQYDMLQVDDYGSDSACTYLCWTNAIVLVLGVLIGSYLLAMCCTGREAFGLE